LCLVSGYVALWHCADKQIFPHSVVSPWLSCTPGDITGRIRSVLPRFLCRGASSRGQTPGAPLLGVQPEASGLDCANQLVCPWRPKVLSDFQGKGDMQVLGLSGFCLGQPQKTSQVIAFCPPSAPTPLRLSLEKESFSFCK
jgi:hypothetical protein